MANGGGRLSFLRTTGSGGASSSSHGGISGRSFTTALDGVTHLTEMDVGAAAPDFFCDLGDCCGHEGGMAPSLGGYLRLIPSSPRGVGGAGGADLRMFLGAGGRQRGGISICLIKEAVLGFFSRQDDVLFDTWTH
jgi:hypothetical protein